MSLAVEDPTVPHSKPQKKRNSFTPETSKKAIQSRMKRSRETQEFLDSLKEQAVSIESPSLQEFIKRNPSKRKEVIRELLERNLYIRLKHQHSLIASGDPLKKHEARKEDLGIGLEWDKLYKDSDHVQNQVHVPAKLLTQINVKIGIVNTVNSTQPIVRLDNQSQDAPNVAVSVEIPESVDVHS